VPFRGNPTPKSRITFHASRVTTVQSALNYVLVTPARNEQDFIELTIKSVVAQTVRPLKWVIVSDGSTDRTDEIVQKHAAQHDWIEFLRMPERTERDFAGKVGCFNAGYARVKHLSYDIIANLDADITFDSRYFEFLLGKLAENTSLGVVGTPFVEDFDKPEKHSYAGKSANLSHVSGACQTFRRKCFEEIGGYVPIKGGGIDWMAVTTARMKGWQTRTFLEKVCYHHRKMGTATRGPIMARFRHGQEDYYVGGHPLWQIVKGISQMRERPLVVGGAMLIFGYFWALLKRMQRPASRELIEFYRAEQMQRLREILSRRQKGKAKAVGAETVMGR